MQEAITDFALVNLVEDWWSGAGSNRRPFHGAAVLPTPSVRTRRQEAEGQPYATAMGMHGGFIIAQCDWPGLRRALEDHCGPLLDHGAVSQAAWSSMPRGEAVLHVTSHNGCCYALDPLMALSNNSDFIVTLSRQLTCRVIGAGAETVSGTFWFTAASKGRLLRLHYDQKVAITQPFDIGPRLPTESLSPFDQPDGIGILAPVHAGGDNVDILLHGPAEGGRRFQYAGDRFPEPGQLEQQIREHSQTHSRPDTDNWQDNITVVPRGNGAYDLRGWTS
jgi:hypothetical protein